LANGKAPGRIEILAQAAADNLYRDRSQIKPLGGQGNFQIVTPGKTAFINIFLDSGKMHITGQRPADGLEYVGAGPGDLFVFCFFLCCWMFFFCCVDVCVFVLLLLRLFCLLCRRLCLFLFHGYRLSLFLGVFVFPCFLTV